MVIWIWRRFCEDERNATKIETNKTLMTISRKLNMIKKTSLVSHLAQFFLVESNNVAAEKREERKEKFKYFIVLFSAPF